MIGLPLEKDFFDRSHPWLTQPLVKAIPPAVLFQGTERTPSRQVRLTFLRWFARSSPDGDIAGEAVASSLDEELEELTHWDIF